MLVGSDQLQHRPAPSAPRAEPDDVDDDGDGDVEVEAFRDIHPEPSPPHLPPPLRQPSWDAASHRSLSSSGVGGGGDAELFATMSREFTAMVAAGSSSAANPDVPGDAADLNLLQLSRIGEHELAPPTDETNALAIVPAADSGGALPAPVEQVKKEEVEAKVAAWQAEEVAKINNKFKREEVVINGWESQQVDKANAWLAKIERKLEGERAKATEKAQNEAAAARRKAEERRASAEARRGRKTAEVLDRANFCKAACRVPSKRSFFSF